MKARTLSSSLNAELDRAKFLALPDIAAFTAWLAAELPSLPVHLKLRRSQFVPQAIDVRLTGIEQVRDHYQWKGTWPVVQLQLSTLRADLQAAVQAGDDEAAYLASVAILDWGNVPKSTSFLETLRFDRKLVSYLTTRARLLSPVGTQQLTELTKTVFYKFNSGLTKVHALLDGHGSPIYDGRVGAAIAMLYHPNLLRITLRRVSELGILRPLDFDRHADGDVASDPAPGPPLHWRRGHDHRPVPRRSC